MRDTVLSRVKLICLMKGDVVTVFLYGRIGSSAGFIRTDSFAVFCMQSD